ncbi:MAG: glycoside hydrolase family 127 protein, partial [Spirochaetales bacterium]|nr:glycoside hydrolase family 127 protein [Spirochaetales bacterium]
MKTPGLTNVRMEGGLLGQKNDLVREKVIPYQWRALNDDIADAEPSYAIKNFKIAAGEMEGDFGGMVFQDSDVAKWLEAVAYQLATHPDETLKKTADSVIDIIEKAQDDNGYLNTRFTIKDRDKRWTNLAECHELYCAGHMLEAAVAYFEATGERKLLDVMIRFVDHIGSIFGPGEGRKKGYPGHQEIELALMRLYKITGEKKHLDLARYFIDERGTQPHYFDLEYEARGKTDFWPDFYKGGKEYHQSHLPVREQKTAVGHSVRAVYMYTAMADIAARTGDESLKEACRTLWKNTTEKQMYVTAGIGSSGFQEAFTFDYDMPADRAYTETCASIGLVFWASRMLNMEKDGRYADVMERALYNGVMSGMNQDGDRFFYVNPLEVWPDACEKRKDHDHVKPIRQKWYGCACCPPNIARLFASIGEYIYSVTDQDLYVHLYNSSSVSWKGLSLKQKTEYPWNGRISMTIGGNTDTESSIYLRIPGWCRSWTVMVNGEE